MPTANKLSRLDWIVTIGVSLLAVAVGIASFVGGNYSWGWTCLGLLIAVVVLALTAASTPAGDKKRKSYVWGGILTLAGIAATALSSFTSNV